MKSPSTKSYVSIVSCSTEKAYSSFPGLRTLELILFINTFLPNGLNPRPSLYNISTKNHLNCLKNLLFESLFLWVFVTIFGCSNIFDQRLLFDHKQLSIWPLELSQHYEPGNQSVNQLLKPLRNSLNVSHAKFDVQDFWRCCLESVPFQQGNFMIKNYYNIVLSRCNNLLFASHPVDPMCSSPNLLSIPDSSPMSSACQSNH